ncbi:ethylmalonyl-CoA decarboxylase-like [Acanthaster planci]|uniref:Ethylmalonyl-CoA decarboxylase n=1 Tax=Acanthaster planci TaxID=133434 RepID=A0A8B7YI19_ACAPL|nr:ethylmalonyl-CoA decarboxylase-like [Acanthaster planci]XP_022092266.1 ethylmalonyl-CoA decarboxylase-like [Acanthaster planci]XP_022092276.1 ethylmalonyl-CoA decarboxylase-like [Acanthaster planci]XP_022092285.1 ethylmalonyl-CoA decarboxylase-like [Acanthaster planci]XP_022092294.1 ethylmalonyl-CoA decarboxylase-like [Acanthaster planci]XP_022092301.1 ethylmalonyl-CoA decarboxylase-like [Acanthaster planci]
MRSRLLQLRSQVTPILSGLRHRPIHYQTDSSGIKLSETANSHYMDQRRNTALANEFVPSEVFNERVERLNLKELNGGSLRLSKNDVTGLATITISNVTNANAMSGSMMVDLSDIVADLEKWQRGKAVILHGDPEGKNFCSGADLKTTEALSSPQAGVVMCLFMQNILTRLQQLPLISVAAVSGSAVGGGAEIITACDFRLVSPSSVIQFIHCKMGLSPGWGGGTRLVRLVGPQKALKLLAGGESIRATESLGLGLADDLIQGDDIIKQASDWLDKYTSQPVEVVRAMKNVVTAASQLPPDKALSKEKDIFGGLWKGPANKEALARALSKKRRK